MLGRVSIKVVSLAAVVIMPVTGALAITGTIQSAFASPSRCHVSDHHGPPPGRPIGQPSNRPVGEEGGSHVGQPPGRPVGPPCKTMSPPVSPPVSGPVHRPGDNDDQGHDSDEQGHDADEQGHDAVEHTARHSGTRTNFRDR
jgi:hypothetical protein